MTLEKAIKERHLNKIQEILTREPEIIDVPINSQWPPFLAAETGDVEIIRYIVEYSRASMNVSDEENRDILYYGVLSGNVELVRYLVEKVGMNPLHGDRQLQTPFDLAVKTGLTEIQKYFEMYLGAPYEDFYRNPILTGMHPDPSIVCVDEDFYMVNSSFVFFPCIPISHSKDLVNWKTIGYAITNPEWAGLDELEGGRGYWAPDISYFEGIFYITATYRLNDTGTIYRKQMVTSSFRPEGPYEKPVFLDEDGIDPSIFTDIDRRRYMILNRGARAFEISADGKEQLSKAKLLYYGHQKRAPEGSHLIYKDGWYYLFQAEGGTGEGHRISVSRASELFGNYTPCPYNPILRQTDEKSLIQCCGHGKPVQAPDGEWYIVYLCSRKWDGKYGFLGRETMLNKLTWTADGWPMINDGQGPGTFQKRPTHLRKRNSGLQGQNSYTQNRTKDLQKRDYDVLEKQVTVSDKTNENVAYSTELFSGFLVSEDWWTVRSIEKNAISRINDRIQIKGSRIDLDSRHARNLLLRRQTSFRYQFEFRLLIPELALGQYLGMTCYYDENTYLFYGVKKVKNENYLFLSEHILDDTTIAKQMELEHLVFGSCGRGVEVTLRVEVNGLERTFYYKDNNEFHVFAVLPDVYYLCDEGVKRGKRFTGAMVGFFVYQANEKEVTGEFTDIIYGDNNE